MAMVVKWEEGGGRQDGPRHFVACSPTLQPEPFGLTAKWPDDGSHNISVTLVAPAIQDSSVENLDLSARLVSMANTEIPSVALLSKLLLMRFHAAASGPNTRDARCPLGLVCSWRLCSIGSRWAQPRELSPMWETILYRKIRCRSFSRSSSR